MNVQAACFHLLSDEIYVPVNPRMEVIEYTDGIKEEPQPWWLRWLPPEIRPMPALTPVKQSAKKWVDLTLQSIVKTDKSLQYNFQAVASERWALHRMVFGLYKFLDDLERDISHFGSLAEGDTINITYTLGVKDMTNPN